MSRTEGPPYVPVCVTLVYSKDSSRTLYEPAFHG